MLDKKVKIVHIISNLSIGGAQLLLLDILKNLKNQNFEIFVITIDSGFYISKFEEAGIKVIDLKLRGLINPFIFFKLKKVLKKIRPDIVNTHLLKADFYGRIVAKLLKIPVIVATIHTNSTSHKNKNQNRKTVLDILDNFVIYYSDSKLIAISNKVKEYLIKRKKNIETSIEVIYNGINIEKQNYSQTPAEIEAFRNSLGISKTDFLITVVGRLEEHKGHINFISSISDILLQNDLKLLIVGEGALKSKIKLLIEKYKLSEKIIFTGFQPNTDRYIEISDLICVPSLQEGFGLSVCEGMIKSKIVLCSNVGGIPEIVTDSFDGYIYDIQNTNELKTKLLYIINNFFILNYIGSNAVNTVKEKFDIKKLSNKLANYYYKLLSDTKNI